MTKNRLPKFSDGNKTILPDTCENILASVEAGHLQMEALSRGHYPGARIPQGVLPGLKTLGFFNADREQHWGTGWHCNEGVEISYVEKGHVDFISEIDGHNEFYSLEPGDVTVTWPWQRHCLGDPNVSPTRFYWLMIDVGVRSLDQTWRWPRWIMLRPEDCKEFSSHVSRLDNPVFPGSSDLGRCFRRIADFLVSDDSPRSWSLLTVLINEIFVLLGDQLRRESAPEGDSSRLALEVVDRFWRDLVENQQALAYTWKLDELARRCGFGVTQFVHHTQALTNSSPMHYLRQCRLRWATRLLLINPQLTITEVALRCGFGSGQHFAKLFRQQFGCSPQTYRVAKSGTL